ncbi:GWxTD domain-containing protein [Gracilimonas sp.]|uniref:GWxTD domain-containing protein n=1 Tax=Gracilimonas sp. TaxID=1974203 RepID=UPI0032EE26B0
MLTVKILLTLLFSLVQLNSYSLVQQIPTDPYQEGKNAIEKGDWKEGITIWIQYSNIADSSEIDPRIGFEYIEFITQNKYKKYYKYAAPLYYKALSRNSVDKYKSVYLKELEKAKPLIENKDYRLWKNQIEDGDIKGLENLKKFWQQKDVTISDTYNERLIEFWERIAYIKKTFNRNKSTVYGTDDRGLIYLKLGNPDYIREGVLQYNQLQAEGWAQTIIINNYNSTTSISDSSFASSSLIGASYNSTALAKNLAYLARQYFDYPQYEIWIYKNENDYRNLVHIFGQNGNTGEFSIINTIDDFIPRSAFRKNYASDSQYPVPPATLLQMIYYSQLTTIDRFFASTYIDLQEDILNNTEINNRNLAHKYRSIHQSKMNTLTALNPSEKSGLDDLNTLNLNVRRYRILDENNQNMVITYLYAAPYEQILMSTLTGELSPENLLLNYTIQLRDNNWNLLFKDVRSTRLNDAVLQNNANNYITVAFLVPNIEDANNLFGVELTAINSGDVDSSEKVENLKAYSKLEEKSMEPLSTDPNQLEASDLILGYADSSSIEAGSEIPFFITPDNIIPTNNSLFLRFEVYHLDLDNGSSEFSMNYRITEVEDGFFKRLFNRNNELKSITVNLNSSSSTYKNSFEIVTEKLEPGTYNLIATIKDLNSGQEIEKEIEFSISDKANY